MQAPSLRRVLGTARSTRCLKRFGLFRTKIANDYLWPPVYVDDRFLLQLDRMTGVFFEDSFYIDLFYLWHISASFLFSIIKIISPALLYGP